MTLITVFFIAQSFFHVENKQLFYPEPLSADSFHAYDVLHYLIDLDLAMDSPYLEGAVTISVRSNENNLNEIQLHLLDMDVDSIRVDGISSTYNHSHDTIFVTLPQTYNQGDSFDIMVGYSGTGSGNMGYIWLQSTNAISYTLGCPYMTKRWLPCFNYNWDKADYGVEFYITVPETFTVCATGEYLGKQVVADKATYHWKHSYPISPYLMHFASSIYMTFSDWYHPSPAESIEIKYYFWPQDSNSARNAFQLSTNMMYFLDSLYGDYPFERYGNDVVQSFYYGGMEHQTMATLDRSWILGTPQTYGMAHEMSHMWWGDMVTCFDWKNVWLNEGFATYSDALYKEYRESHQSFINLMKSRRNSYFSAEASNPHPIYDPAVIFETSHAYNKGSWVLHMIRYMCGDDNTWLELMSTYRDSFAYKNASTDDLNRIMNQVLGDNYDWFFQEWVYDSFYPIYDIDWQKVYESPNWRLTLDLTQTQTIGPPVFHMPLPIGVYFSSGDTILTLEIDESPEHFEFLFSQEPDSIVVDPEVWIIQKNTVTGVSEGVVNRKVLTDKIGTIGRAIDVMLTEPKWIKIYDITGRKVDEFYTKELNYRPSSAGIYHVIIGNKKEKIVIIK